MSTATFEILHSIFEGRPLRGIKCLVCGMVSWSQGDVDNEYCGSCHQYHDIMATDPVCVAKVLSDRIVAKRERDKSRGEK